MADVLLELTGPADAVDEALGRLARKHYVAFSRRQAPAGKRVVSVHPRANDQHFRALRLPLLLADLRRAGLGVQWV
jgi:hypothetical protein